MLGLAHSCEGLPQQPQHGRLVDIPKRVREENNAPNSYPMIPLNITGTSKQRVNRALNTAEHRNTNETNKTKLCKYSLKPTSQTEDIHVNSSLRTLL